jgi:hypothetical protein
MDTFSNKEMMQDTNQDDHKNFVGTFCNCLTIIKPSGQEIVQKIKSTFFLINSVIILFCSIK